MPPHQSSAWLQLTLDGPVRQEQVGRSGGKKKRGHSSSPTWLWKAKQGDRTILFWLHLQKGSNWNRIIMVVFFSSIAAVFVAAGFKRSCIFLLESSHKVRRGVGWNCWVGGGLREVADRHGLLGTPSVCCCLQATTWSYNFSLLHGWASSALRYYPFHIASGSPKLIGLLMATLWESWQRWQMNHKKSWLSAASYSTMPFNYLILSTNLWFFFKAACKYS